MPSFLSEGPGATAKLPHIKTPSENGPTSTSLREQLKTLIDDKQKQLVLVGTLGQRFLSQQVELEERIQQMDEVENASEMGELGNGDDLRQKIEELAHTMQQWETENQQMWTTALTLGSRMANGDELAGNHTLGEGMTSFSTSFGEDISLPAEAGPSAVQSSRRARNVGLPRTNNVEFATEIGNHLTREIRRMHALLSERDKALQDMKEERDDLEKSLESLRSALREREASADKFKDENWNLEFQLQEIRGKLVDAEAAAQRAEAEQKRTMKQLTTARETIDVHKNESERLQASLGDLKGKHETDVAQMRRTAASLQREKSDLQTVLDELKTDLAKKSRSVPNRFNSPITPTEAYGTPGENDVFTDGNSTRRKYDISAMLTPSEAFDTSPDASPSRPSVVVTPSHPSNEVEALRQSLAHAHRQMSTLKNSINREKELKMEYRRKLNQEGIAVDWEDEENLMEGSPHHPRSRGGTPSRGGKSGRGRGTGKLSLAHLLGMAAAERALEAPDSPYRQQDDGTELVSQDAGLEDEEPSPFIDTKSSRPTSLDGMDPAFANVLRVVPSDDIINTSPIPPRSRTLPRRQRGGGAFKDQRPASLVDTAPTALSAELGQDDGQGNDSINEAMIGDEDQFEDPLLAYRSYVETAEIGIQSDPEPIAPVPHVIQTSEVAIQSDPEPEARKVDASSQADLVLPPAPSSLKVSTMDASNLSAHSVKSVETMDASMQWEPVPLQTASMSCQTDEILLPSMSEVSISTEPEPEHVDGVVSTDPPHVVDAYTQTATISFTHVLTQTTPSATSEAQIQVDPPPPAPTSVPVPVIIEPRTSSQQIPLTISTSSDIVVPRPSSHGRSPVQRPVAMLFESDSEETETETEAEYVDARENEPTPSSSVQDFQSFQTATPDDGESDSESIRTSTGVGAVYRTSPMGSRILRMRHDSQATTRVAAPPKPELKEMSVQTDDWSPPKSPVTAVNAINFHRVGSAQSTQFQYIPSSPIKATSSSLAVATNMGKPPIRDSVGTFGITGRIRTPSITSGDQRPSMDSFASRADEVPPSPGLSIPSPVAPVDKTRPPTMSLPPPPSMPPPSTLPVKKGSVPPPRPTSPPPPELIQRATTPTFGRQSSLMVPTNRMNRPSGGSMPPSQTTLRKPPSTSSFRSAANAASRAGPRSGPPPSTFINAAGDRRDMSQTSLLSGSSVPSRHHSVSSSRSSERKAVQSVPQTPPNVSGGSTDPAVIHAITQTMIGEFLYKYTRRVVGKGHGEKRHKRFFWVHPYTKTLYWSSADPGASNAGESNAKSAYIDAVKSVLDPNPLPPGLHQYSIVVYTPQREMKFTAPTKERHDIWFRALSYLLDRPSTVPVTSPAGGSMPASPMPSRQRPGTPGEDGMHRATPAMVASPSSVRSAVSNGSVDSWNLTPRARAQTHLSPPSVGRRAGTPAAEYLRTYSDTQYRPFADAQSPTKSIRSLQQRFEDALDDRDDEDFETLDNHLPHLNSGEFEINTDGSEGFEGLENVRACCDGEHDLNHLAKGPGHHHHHHHRHHHVNQAAIRPSSRMSSRPDPISPSSRPVSPSAWSFRSRSGSQPSDGASLFSWGGGGDGNGKRSIRFGSKRSTKSSTPVPS